MGRTESSAPTNGSADVLTGRRDTRVPPYRVRRFYGADRVVRPYEICHCEERSDAAIRSPQPKETDSHASDTVTGSE